MKDKINTDDYLYNILNFFDSELCENLTKNSSTGKKDYKTIMSGIIAVLNEKGKKHETILNIY